MNIENDFLINYKCDYFLNVITKYDVRNIYHRYKKILETWNPGLNFQTSEELIFVKQEPISEHNVTFTKAHRSIAQHDLGDVETNREPQYVKNGCKYFLYWLYFEVLEKKVDYHKVLKFYEDVIKGYMEESGNRHLDDYVSFRSDKTIEKFIKLTEMYDYFHKFKEEDKQHADRKCGYARECVLLYNKNIEICEEGNDYDFCYELDNLKKSYDEYMITNEDCSGLQKTLESYRLFNPTVVIITPFSILLVISLSLFFLYKFTPFGYIFRKRKKNNKKIPDNQDYATHVLPHTSQRVNNYNNNR